MKPAKDDWATSTEVNIPQAEVSDVSISCSLSAMSPVEIRLSVVVAVPISATFFARYSVLHSFVHIFCPELLQTFSRRGVVIHCCITVHSYHVLVETHSVSKRYLLPSQ